MQEIDPLALEVTGEFNHDAEERKKDEISSATWEHEELAQVRIKVIRGHKDTVKSCQFCENDQRMLSASHDKTVMLWDFATGKNLHTYEAHTDCISQARASPVDHCFVSVGWDKKVHLWDTETGQIKWTGEHGGIVTSCNFSHDGSQIVSGSDLDNTVCIWDVHCGHLIQEIKALHTSTVTSVQFSPEDDRIITTSMDQTAKFYDCKSNTVTLTLNNSGSVHVNVISAAACSRNQHKLATVSWDKSIAIWDISTGMFRSKGPTKIEKAHEGSISTCCFSNDVTGSMLVTGGYDCAVALWDIEMMTEKLRLQGHTGWVEDVSYSQDMKWLLSASKDCTVRLWNIEDCDNIPVVLANSKSIGLRMFKCAACDKPFSMSQGDNKDSSLCVFCRLQNPDRNIPTIEA